MTNHPTIIGEPLEQVIERVVFADPLTHRIRDEWEETRREVYVLFERACTEQYELRLDYHRSCGEPNAEDLARREAALIQPMLAEEREQRLALVWAEIARRARAVVAEKDTAAGEKLPITEASSDGVNANA